MTALALALALAASPAPVPEKSAACIWACLDWGIGPSVAALEYLPGNPHPVQVAAGAGVQLSLTHDALKVAFGGLSWDVLALDLDIFGTKITAAGGQQFGALSAAGGVCTMSELFCLMVGKPIVAADSSLVSGGWFYLLSLNFNVAIGPFAPPVGVAPGAAGLKRAWTIYLQI